MSRYITVSAKIPKELYEKLRKHGININRLIREKLEEEVERLEDEEIIHMLGRISKKLKKIPTEELIEIIRSTRMEH